MCYNINSILKSYISKHFIVYFLLSLDIVKNKIILYLYINKLHSKSQDFNLKKKGM